MKTISDYNNNTISVPNKVYDLIQKSYNKKYAGGYSFVTNEDIKEIEDKNFKSINLVFLEETEIEYQYSIETNKKDIDLLDQEIIEIIYVKKEILK